MALPRTQLLRPKTREGILSSSRLSSSFFRPCTQAQHSIMRFIQVSVCASQLPPTSWYPCKAGLCLYLLELLLGVKNIFYLKQIGQCFVHKCLVHVPNCHRARFTKGGASAPALLCHQELVCGRPWANICFMCEYKALLRGFPLAFHFTFMSVLQKKESWGNTFLLRRKQVKNEKCFMTYCWHLLVSCGHQAAA